MVRTTFGPTGNAIRIIEHDTDIDDGEARQTTIIDDQPGTVPNFAVVDGDSDGEDSGEIGDDSGADYRPRTIDPATAATSARTGRPKRKYTKRTGTANAATARTATDAATAEKTAFITGNLEKVLYNLHVMGATLLNTPQLKRSTTDCAMLAEALKDVAAAHDFEKVINPKYMAWVQLCVVLIIVYFGEDISELIFGKKPKRGTMTVMQPQPGVQ